MNSEQKKNEIAKKFSAQIDDDDHYNWIEFSSSAFMTLSKPFGYNSNNNNSGFKWIKPQNDVVVANIF